jgi:hypothetical protein
MTQSVPSALTVAGVSKHLQEPPVPPIALSRPCTKDSAQLLVCLKFCLWRSESEPVLRPGLPLVQQSPRCTHSAITGCEESL